MEETLDARSGRNEPIEERIRKLQCAIVCDVPRSEHARRQEVQVPDEDVRALEIFKGRPITAHAARRLDTCQLFIECTLRSPQARISVRSAIVWQRRQQDEAAQFLNQARTLRLVDTRRLRMTPSEPFGVVKLVARGLDQVDPAGVAPLPWLDVSGPGEAPRPSRCRRK
jgi:hypothetical protein